MIEVEVFGIGLAPESPPIEEVERLCALCAAARGVADGHVAVEYVGTSRITELNVRHRNKEGPTDVLSFPIDGIDSPANEGSTGGGPVAAGPIGEDEGAPLELGDIVICPGHTVDLREAIVHGMLHLLGMDHETDDGEMLALQDELLAGYEQ